MKKPRGASPVGDLVSRVVDPALRKKTGLSISLVENWSEIAGSEVAGRTRPLKIQWPARTDIEDEFKPGTLILACDQSVILKVQYQTSELISKLNGFFGYSAVDRIKIVQRPVTEWREHKNPVKNPPTPEETAWVGEKTQNIDDLELRKSLERLGRSIIGDRSS